MQHYTFRPIVAQAYGQGNYNTCVYNDTTSCSTAASGSTSSGSSNSGLVNTGIAVTAIVTVACMITFVALIVRFASRKGKNRQEFAEQEAQDEDDTDLPFQTKQ